MKRQEILEVCKNLGELLFRKNQAYGSSFAKSGKILEILFDGRPIPARMFTQALLIVRVLDKLSRIAKDADAFGETPWGDIAGYGILGMILSGRPFPAPESEPPQPQPQPQPPRVYYRSAPHDTDDVAFAAPESTDDVAFAAPEPTTE